ncbi:MAG: hypothetical protein IJT66_06935, partial [Clostridia bacterium]|nr:hypothetical protein [Clostridia bacterium]
LFVADTGNNRIVKLDQQGNVCALFDNAGHGGFQNPQGIFVDENGNMYVGDTDHGRIVHLDSEGDFVEELGRPAELPEDVNYLPAKLAISSTGMIYVVHGQNILTIDSTNTFRGYFGQAEISFDITETLIRLFASEEQKATRSKRLAASYHNIAIDGTDRIYAATSDTTLGELKRLNSVGVNTYRETGSTGAFSLDWKRLFLSDSYVSSSGTAFYGDRFDDEGHAVKPKFSDVAFDQAGLYYALDQTTCRVFVYDGEGSLLGTFGGKGIQKGKFYNPTALALAKDGTAYVLDAYLSNLQCFRPTQFKNNISQALSYFYDGRYDSAFALWNEVLAVNEHYTTALNGIAKCYEKQGDYRQAMIHFKKADNPSGYSDAFSSYSHDYFRSHFLLCVGLGVFFFALFVALIAGLLKLSRKVCLLHDTRSPERFGLWRQFQMTAAAVFHPCESFDNVRYMRGHVHWAPALILPLLAVGVRFLYMHIVHYPLADVDLREVSYILEAVKILLPFCTFIIAAYAVTAIMSGEVKFKELYFAGALCFAPYILFTLPVGALSNILSSSFSGFYTVLRNAIWIWQLFLFFNTVRVTNRFTVKKTVGVVIISLLVMLLLWIVAFLLLVLLDQVYLFLKDIFTEIGFRV